MKCIMCDKIGGTLLDMGNGEGYKYICGDCWELAHKLYVERYVDKIIYKDKSRNTTVEPETPQINPEQVKAVGKAWFTFCKLFKDGYNEAKREREKINDMNINPYKHF